VHALTCIYAHVCTGRADLDERSWDAVQ
jgi:hypothetical protein